MSLEETQVKEFVIPTRYKARIGSYLSWPFGALELSKTFADVPQVKELQLHFGEHWSKFHKGKWPESFRVVEVRYARHRTQYAPIAGWNDSLWYLTICPVPRNMRMEIREALKQHGFRPITDWLLGHAEYSGREGNLSFTGFWNSDSNKLSFESRDSVLPEVSTDKQRNRK